MKFLPTQCSEATFTPHISTLQTRFSQKANKKSLSQVFSKEKMLRIGIFCLVFGKIKNTLICLTFRWSKFVYDSATERHKLQKNYLIGSKAFLKPHSNSLKYTSICDFTRCFHKLSVEESSGVAEAPETTGTRPNHVVASSILLFW